MLEWLNAPDKKPPPVLFLPAHRVSFRTETQMLLRIDDDTETVKYQQIDIGIDDVPLHVMMPAEPDKKGD